MLSRLDELLWTYAPDSFLPHGRDNAGTQPILLSESCEAANGASHILIADGLWREGAFGFERVFYLFEYVRSYVEEKLEAFDARFGTDTSAPTFERDQKTSVHFYVPTTASIISQR